MKKIATLLFTLAFALQVSAQNKDILHWFNQLAADSGNVEYQAQSQYEEFIYHYSFGKNERQQVQSLVQKMRNWLDQHASSALKSYRYEVHYPETDTITYSMALNNRESIFSFGKLCKELPNVSELLAYDYKFSTDDKAYNRMDLRYYREKVSEISDSLKPGKAEDLHHALNAYLKIWSFFKFKTYKVQYEYSDTFQCTKSKIPMQQFYWKPLASTAKGTHYFLPLKEEKMNEAYEMLSGLFKSFIMNRKDQEFYLSMNMNPKKQIHELMTEKRYRSIEILTISNMFPNIVADPHGPEQPYMIQVNCDKNGLHILELYSTTQFIKFPAFWINIKSMKDNEYKYEKDFKLDYQF